MTMTDDRPQGVEIGRIPIAYRAACELCGITLDIRAPGICQRATGWIEPNRGSGGANHLLVAERERKWAHKWCCQNPRLIDQGSLF